MHRDPPIKEDPPVPELKIASRPSTSTERHLTRRERRLLRLAHSSAVVVRQCHVALAHPGDDRPLEIACGQLSLALRDFSRWRGRAEAA